MESVDADATETVGEQDETEICMAESCPGRAVFSESDNPEGWIGTNLVVEVER